MAVIVIGTILIAWCAAWIGSRQHVLGAAIMSIIGAVITLTLQMRLRDVLALQFIGWHGPVLILANTVVMLVCVRMHWFAPPLVVNDVATGIRRMFAERRRRTSINADLRRRLKSYNVEVG